MEFLSVGSWPLARGLGRLIKKPPFPREERRLVFQANADLESELKARSGEFGSESREHLFHNRQQVRFSGLRRTLWPLPALVTAYAVSVDSGTMPLGFPADTGKIAYSGATVSDFHRVPLDLRSES